MLIKSHIKSLVKKNTTSLLNINRGGILENPIIVTLVEQLTSEQDGKIKSELVTVDGSERVATWIDISGASNDASQSINLRKPIYTESIINGHPTLDFDGTNDSLIGSSSLQSIPLADHTLFFAMRLGSPSPSEIECLSNWNDSGGDVDSELYCFDSTGKFRLLGTIGTEDLITDNLKNTNFIISIAVDHGNTIVTRLNGVQKSSFSINAVNDAPDSYVICAELDTGSSTGNFLDAQLGEKLMYTSRLSDPDILSVNQYLSTKFGIPLD